MVECLGDTEAIVEWPEGTERLLWTWHVVEEIRRLLWNVLERTNSVLECSRRHWEPAVECRGARRDAWGQKVARWRGSRGGFLAAGPGSLLPLVSWASEIGPGAPGASGSPRPCRWVASLRPGLGRVRGRQGGVVEGLTRRSPSVLPQGPWPRSRSGGVAPTPAGAAAASGCICLCGAGRGTCGWRTRGRRRAAGRAP